MRRSRQPAKDPADRLRVSVQNGGLSQRQGMRERDTSERKEKLDDSGERSGTSGRQLPYAVVNPGFGREEMSPRTPHPGAQLPRAKGSCEGRIYNDRNPPTGAVRMGRKEKELQTQDLRIRRKALSHPQGSPMGPNRTKSGRVRLSVNKRPRR